MYGTVALQHVVDVHLASTYGESERFDRFVSGWCFGFGEHVDAVLKHELLHRSAALPCDRIDFLALKGAARHTEFGSGKFGSSTDCGLGEEDTVGVRFVFHGERRVLLRLAIHDDVAVAVDGERDIVGHRIAGRRLGFGQGVVARLQLKLLRFALFGDPLNRVDGLTGKRATGDAHVRAGDVRDAIRQTVLVDGDAVRLIDVDHGDQVVGNGSIAAVGLPHLDLQFAPIVRFHPENDVVGFRIAGRSSSFRQRIGTGFQLETIRRTVGYP